MSVGTCLARLIDEQDRLSDDDRDRLTRAANIIHDYRHAIRSRHVLLFVPNPSRSMVARARRDIVDIWRRQHPDVPVRERRLDRWLSRAT
jgi:hypothetical protein